MAYRIETSPDAQKTLDWLDERIYECNAHVTGHSDGRLFASTAVDDQGDQVGGIAGWTWAGACEISLLWIHEQHRGHGLGRLLLDAAEQQAINAGCSAILVRSHSFQAPEFYQKYGYTVEHVVKNFPEGHHWYTLLKSLKP